MKILKFGGTSVGSAERMKHVAQLIRKPGSAIVVLSAMAGTTNQLVQIANLLHQKEAAKANNLIDTLQQHYYKVIDELYSEPAYKEKATEIVISHFDFLKSFTLDLFTVYEEKAVLAQGELLSTALFQLYLEEAGVQSVLLPALNFMRLGQHNEPDLTYISKALKAELSKHKGNNLFITQGFICRNDYGEIDNLKRGGSDYSASLMGAALDAEEIQIWTDITGMHNNDPRIVKGTYPIAELSFDEAAELAYFGAKILHPSSVLPARERNIPVRLLNTMEPEAAGTIISGKSSGSHIKAVAAKEGITAIKIKSSRMLLAYGFLRSVFEVFERYKTPIDMITTSEVAVSLTIDDPTHLTAIKEELAQYGHVEIDSGLSIVCIVGDFLDDKPGYAMQVFQSLQHIPLRMISYGGSRNNISILITTENKVAALQALNDGIFANKQPSHV